MFGYFILFALCLAAVAVAWARLEAARPYPTQQSWRAQPQPTRPEEPRDDDLGRAPRARALVYGRPFEFAFVDQGGAEGWRSYILHQPSYGPWAQGGHESHRYWDSGRNCHFVCIDGGRQPVRTLREAAALAQMWAKGTVRYIDTGRGF
jgi:hypothetical protein